MIDSDISDDYNRIAGSSKVFLSNFIECVENIFVSGRLEDALQYEKRLLDRYEQRKFFRILNHCLRGVEYSYGNEGWHLKKVKNGAGKAILSMLLSIMRDLDTMR
jgi:hypothetical protein